MLCISGLVICNGLTEYNINLLGDSACNESWSEKMIIGFSTSVSQVVSS
jgi:hypothetical protein